ncbi:ESPR-type extended signal peptide-containing protein [Acidaminococcus timonensis]|uniref:ESPR-type extended signal peptide-containing protein n=1 Tax=Acidaminococcus timonensis TaxID=1871002 RepID=UPI00248C85C5|nr:ESPR-type extended signal peptide-containing protein [Acidaminococcus timonensis]
MNKIYKVIYSKVRHCYVVVSEIARNQGKAHSSHTSLAGGTCVLALTLGLLLGAPGTVQADSVNLDNGASAYYDANGNLTIGDKQTVAEGKNQKGEHNTTIGTQTDTLRNVTEGDTEGQPLDDDSNTVLVDGEGKAHDLTKSTEAGGSTAVGYNTHNEGDNSTAIGNNAKITNKPVTYYVDADGKKTASPENAVWYKDASGNPTKVPQVFRDAAGNTTATPQYVHTYTEKDPTTGENVTKTEITSDAAKADKDSAENPVYNYKKADNTDKLYSVTLYQAASNSSADNSAVAIGDTAAAKENAVAMGKGTKATAEGSIALGKGSEADRDGGVAGWDPKTGTVSTKSDVAWKSGEGALSIGNGGASRQITNVAAGSEDSDAVNLAQLKNAMTHYYSVKTTSDTDAAGGNNYLNDGATGNNALAAGVSAVATGDNATAVGTNTYASGTNASAYGYRAVASGSGSVAIGSGTSAQQEGSVAIGGHTQGSHAVQVGTDSTAQSAYSVAVGGHAKGEYSVEVGYGSTAQGSYSTSIGGHAIGKNSIAIGRDSNPASAGGDNSIAIGGHTNSTNDIAIGAGSSTSGGQAIAVGGSATGGQAVSVGGVAGSFQATAVGSGSAATGSQSTAVGGHAGNVYSTAVGQGANATYAYTTAVGNNSTASGDHSTALGYGTSAQGSNTTAIGGANANGTNLTVIGNNSTASASDYWDNISNSTAIGGAHISASDAAAIGSNATVNGQYGVALGHNSNVSYASTGVGEGTKASNTGTAVGYGSQSSGYQSAAVGAGSQATGQNAVSLGGGGAWGDYSIALGSGAGTNAHAIALGQNSGAWGENAIAIGEGTNAWRANSIVLGKNSKSGADKNIEGYDPQTGVASVDDTSTWYSTDEAVSIGRAEERDEKGNVTKAAITRQLNNLAAGTLDTDAVNVAQLKLATTKINMHYYSVHSTETGDGSNYANDGATGTNALAVGVMASASGASSMAVGDSAAATAEGGVALGKGPKANTAASDVAGYDVITGTAFAGTTDTSAASPVWHSTSGAVSVGDVAGGLTRRINGVAAGSEDTDAVNVAQLKQVKQAIDTVENHHSTVEAGSSGNVTVTEGTNAASGKKYTVDLNNNVNFGKEDKQISINGDNGTVTIGQGDKQIKLDSKDGSITAGGVTINNGGKGTVNGLTNKTWDSEHITSGQAATEDQLQKVEQNVNQKISNVDQKVDKVAKQHTTVSVNGGQAAGNLIMEKTPETDEKGANYDISLSNDVTIGTKGENGQDGKLTVISQDGSKAITADGKEGTLTLKDGNNETSIKAAEAAKGVDGITDIKRVAVDGHTVATLDDGMKFAGDSGEALKQKLNSTTNIKGGAAGELSDRNIGVVSDGNDTLTVKLAKDIKGLDSVEANTVNATTVNGTRFNVAGDSTHNAITIKQGDVNMGSNTINGVAPGKVSADSTEAVNGSQLYARDQAIGKLGNTVNHLDDKINRAGAGAAALAALHPQDFDPDDKWDFAAGYGNYHGASAAAIGAFYRPTEDVMVSVGGSMGGGENMVNAGVTFKLGQHNHVSNSRVAMAKEIRDLKATVGQLTQMVNQLTGNGSGRTLPLRKGDTLFPDVPKNHWAYDYVTKLAQAGILEGYPDGEFKGNRMMTRYEFATLVYRAIMGGAAANRKLNQGGTLDRLVDEFGDELQYIRIVVIDRDKDGKPTIERVRTVEDDRKHHHGKEREQQLLEQGL